MNEWNIYQFSIKGPNFEQNLNKELKKIVVERKPVEIVLLFKAFEKFKLDLAGKITHRILSLFDPETKCTWATKISESLENEIIVQLITMYKTE